MKFKPVGSDEFQNGDDRNCLVVAVEDLRAAPTPASDTSATVDDGARDQYTRERVFLEARIVHSAEGSAFELQPVTLRFRASVEPSLLGSAARDLQFDVAFSMPGAKEPFARTVVDFRALVPSAKARWRSDHLGTELAKRSGWRPAPPLGAALAARAQELKAAKPGGPARRTSPADQRAWPDHGDGVDGRDTRRQRSVVVVRRPAQIVLVGAAEQRLAQLALGQLFQSTNQRRMAGPPRRVC